MSDFEKCNISKTPSGRYFVTRSLKPKRWLLAGFVSIGVAAILIQLQLTNFIQHSTDTNSLLQLVHHSQQVTQQAVRATIHDDSIKGASSNKTLQLNDANKSLIVLKTAIEKFNSKQINTQFSIASQSATKLLNSVSSMTERSSSEITKLLSIEANFIKAISSLENLLISDITANDYWLNLSAYSLLMLLIITAYLLIAKVMKPLEQILSSHEAEIVEKANKLDTTNDEKHKQQLLFETIVRGSVDGIVIADLDRKITYANQSFLDNFGYNLKEIEGKETSFLYAKMADFIETGKSRFNTQASEKLSSYIVEYLRKDGTIFPGETVGTAIKDETNETLGFVGIIRDVTRRVDSERIIKDNQKRLSLALEGADIAFWDWDINTGRVEFNETWNKILEQEGVPVPNSMSHWQQQIHPNDYQRVMSEIVKTLRGEREVFFYEFRCKTYLGNWKWIQTRGRIFERDENGKALRALGTHLDVTDRKKREEELRRSRNELKKAKELAEEANLAKSTFIAKMSHEIRTPLNGALGMSEHLLSQGLNSKQQETANIIHSSVNSLLAIVNDILDFSKIEAKQLELNPKTVKLSSIMLDCHRYMQLMTNSKAIFYKQSLDDTLPETIVADSGKIQQVLYNLLSNAFKFTPSHGSINLDLKLLEQSPQGYFLQFSVSDTGIGVSTEKHAEIFKAFAQESKETNSLYGGTGLGLAICKELAELMDGDITIESSPGSGSVFRFKCRVSAASPKELEELARHVKSPSSKHSKQRNAKRILIAEDNLVNQKVISAILSSVGYEFEIVDNGAKIIDAMSENDFDLVILDCQMPIMNGFDTAKEIRKRENNSTRLPIVALTAYATEEDAGKCLDAGMDKFLTKPIRKIDLMTAIDELCNETSSE